MKVFMKTILSVLVLSVIFSLSFAHLPSINSTQFINGQVGFGYKGNISRATVEYKNRGEWNGTTEYRGDYSIATGDTVSYGTFNGKKLWWWAKFYAKGESLKPGFFAPQGGTSPWVLINSLSASEGNGTPKYSWVGWNNQLATSMTDMSAVIPTWRDGAVGAYSITLDDIGAMPFDLSIQPAWDLLQDYPEIKMCWGVYVEKMKDNDWNNAIKMVGEGHEMFCHSMRHTSAADQWQWFKPGQKIPSHDPAIPEAIRGLTVVGTWGDPAAEPVYPYVGDGTRVFSSPLVSIKATHYWTQNAPTSEIPGTVLGAPYGTVIEPIVTAKDGVEIITLATGQNQYVKYTKKDTTGEGFNEGYIAAVGPTWLELSDLDNYGALPQYGGAGTGFWQSSVSAAPKEWKWDIQTSIKLGEIVSYSGSYFKALVDAPGMAPTTTPDWSGKVSWEAATYTASDAESALKDTNGTYTGRCWTSTTKYVADDKGAPGFVAKVWCVKKWEAADYKDNIKDANDIINEKLYSKITSAGEYFEKGKVSEYYGYPFDAYSEVTHDSLEQNGFVGARGGAKSGKPIPGDFFHPYRIDFDAFYITKSDWNTNSKGAGYTYPDNPHVLLGMNELIDKVIEQKGYMIRELHAVADIQDDSWFESDKSIGTEEWAINSAAKGKGGWWGGITKNLMKEHFDFLNNKIASNDLTIFTVGEVTKYRMTANVSNTPSITKNGNNYILSVKTKEDIKEKYQDEISVIIKVSDPITKTIGTIGSKITGDFSVLYDNGESPRRRPRQLDAEGKVWSISMNPFKGNVTINPTGEWTGQDVDFETDLVKSKTVTNIIKTKQFGEKISITVPSGSYEVDLVSLNGRIIKSVQFNGTNTTIHTSGISSGAYVMRVISNGKLVNIKKLIIK